MKTTTGRQGREIAETGSDETGQSAAVARPLRADAARNRARILEAAENVFATEGLAVPIDVVAEKAGVGVGTLYRHFPTKEDLFEAIVLERLSNLVCQCEAYETAEDPREALFSYMGQIAQQALAKHDLFDALTSAGVDFKENCAGKMEEMIDLFERLTRRAVEAGTIRAEVSGKDLLGLVMGVIHATAESGDKDGTRVARMLAIVCDGLRTDPAQ